MYCLVLDHIILLLKPKPLPWLVWWCSLGQKQTTQIMRQTFAFMFSLRTNNEYTGGTEVQPTSLQTIYSELHFLVWTVEKHISESENTLYQNLSRNCSTYTV